MNINSTNFREPFLNDENWTYPVDGGFDGVVFEEINVYHAVRNKNLIFISNHDLTFTTKAKECGLDGGNSTQATILGYGHDGDLDLGVAKFHLLHLRRLTLFTLRIGAGQSRFQ